MKDSFRGPRGGLVAFLIITGLVAGTRLGHGCGPAHRA